MLLLLACADSDIKVDGPPDGPPPPAVDIAGPAAIDPLLGAATFTLARTGGDAVTVEVLDAAGARVRTLAAATTTDAVTWDGRDDTGAVVPHGDYVVHADLLDGDAVLASDEASSTIVRVGVTAGTLGGDRVALTWHHNGGAGLYWDGGADTTTFSIAAIDTDGVVTPIPTPWDDLYAPPADPLGQNMPAAYAWDARPTLSLVVAGDVGTAALTAAIDGWTLTSGEVAPGATLVFTKDAAIAEGPRVVEETLSLRWMAGDAVIGAQDVPLRIYALLGPAAFEEAGPAYQPWVAVIDPALRSIEGVEGTDAAVIGGLVEHIYRDLGLSYDTRWGASAYVQYDGMTYNNAHFDLSGFLDRTRGSVINCTDCAAILEAFANMLGATLSYTILAPSFDLNFIQAIGSDHFTQCPFDTGGCGFSYHAVTTPDDGGTIYDATLALDGDADPSGYPAEELLVQAISGEEYLDRLVEDGRPGYRYTQKETLQ